METLPVSKEDRLFAALAYIYWFVAFPVYLVSPRYQGRPFLRYHLYHALGLGLVVYWGGIILWTVAAVLGKFGLFGLLLYPVLRLAEWLALGVTGYAAFSAFRGKQPQIPFLTELVRPYLEEKNS